MYKQFLLIYISIYDLFFCLFGFYGLSTLKGYLMTNPLYRYVKYIICKHIRLNIIEWDWAYILYTVE